MASLQTCSRAEDTLFSDEIVVRLPMMTTTHTDAIPRLNDAMGNAQLAIINSPRSFTSHSDSMQCPYSHLVHVSPNVLDELARSMQELQLRLKNNEERQSISDLRISTLTNENSALKSEIARLRSDLAWFAICSDKFTLFPNLPIELRLKIWRISLTEPQIISIQITKKDGYRYTVPMSQHSPLLQVNREARGEAWKLQKPYYLPPTHTPQIHVNLAIDTLWIPNFNRSLLSFSDPTDSREDVRRLALHYSFFESTINKVTTFEQFLDFPNLKEVYVIYGGDKCVGMTDVKFIEPRENPRYVMKDPDRVQLLRTLLSGYTWKDLGVLDSAGLEIWKDDLQNIRNWALLAGEDVTDHPDLTNWFPPRVIYKEAITKSELKRFR